MRIFKNQISNRTIRLNLIVLLLLLSVPFLVFSQSDNSDLVGMKLEDAEAILAKRGFEIAGSSLMKKEQLWYNSKENNCLSIAFDKKADHIVTEVKAGDVGKCKSGVEASHKVMDSFHDGAAPVSAAAIEKERQKLKENGFVVSYWVKDAAPGRSTEYWKNESTQTCMHIIWNTSDQSDVSSDSCDANYRNNPYPKNN